MTGPSSNPGGEKPGRPGITWQTVLATAGERVIADDEPEPRPNRATRRAARRRKDNR